MPKRIITLYDRIKKNIQSPDLKVLPGQLAFFFFLTLIPTLAVIISIAGNLNISTDYINNLAKTQFPDMFVVLLETVANSDGVQANTLIFFISALFMASNGTRSIINASNRVYKLKSKGYIYDVVKSVLMLFILVFLVLFIVAVPIMGDIILRTCRMLIHNNGFVDGVYKVYQIINLPFSWFIMFITIKLLYTLAPDSYIPSKNVNYGALFTSFTWLLFTKLYSLYIEIVGKVTTLYGSISSLIIFMWWLYFLAYFFVLGIALNVSKYEQKKE